jgi:ElaB/YqjD/DUF883 family membrane-anchored ribosome-binding protein
MIMRETQNGHDEWKAAIEKAQDILEEGRKEMARATQLAKEKGEEAWQAAREKSREAWDDVRASGLNAIDDFRDRSDEMWEDAEKLVKKHPARAMGLTLLVGVVIGALLTRDRD